jgi:hypothetical protein
MRSSWTWLFYSAHPYADAYSNARSSAYTNAYTNANRETKERADDGPAS